MWLSILFASIIGVVLSVVLSNGILAYSYLIGILAFGMTINSSIKYFRERKRGRSYSYAKQRGWDRNSYGKSRARKAGETLALFSVISITGVLLMANYGYMDLDPNAPNDRRFFAAADSDIIEKRVHELINQERSNYGLKSISWDEKLASIAKAHSQDMVNRDYYSHDSPEGISFSDRYSKAGYNCQIQISTNKFSLGGENINYLEGYYYDEKIASAAVNSWMNSEGHKQNILTKYFKNEGIGVAISGNEVYITQNFC